MYEYVALNICVKAWTFSLEKLEKYGEFPKFSVPYKKKREEKLFLSVITEIFLWYA